MRRGVVTAALAALVIAAFGAAPASAAGGTAAPYAVFSGGFVRGANDAQLEASYRRLREMGVRAVRIDFRWADIEPAGQPLHDYDWTRQDALVHVIRAAGLQILGIIDYGQPDYSRAGSAALLGGRGPVGSFGVGDPQYYPPDDPQTFARFAADVARRYRGDVARWEIWNEENGGWRFWEPKEDPVAYGRLLCAAHAAVHGVDPGAPVAFGGLFFPPLGGAIGTGAVKFLGQVLDHGPTGIRRCFDAVAYHPYPYPFTSPEAEVLDRGSVIDAADQLERVLGAHGIAGTPLWNTEVGWPTNPRGNGVTEARQARYTARLSLLSWAHGVRLLTWYTWGDRQDPGGKDQEAHFGFFRADGTAKPAERALVALHRTLGADWRFVADRSRALGLPRGRAGVGQGFALEFRGPARRHVLALWYADERPPHGPSPFAPVEPATGPRTITIRMPSHRGAVVHDVFGRRVGVVGADLAVGQAPRYVSWKG